MSDLAALFGSITFLVAIYMVFLGIQRIFRNEDRLQENITWFKIGKLQQIAQRHGLNLTDIKRQYLKTEQEFDTPTFEKQLTKELQDDIKKYTKKESNSSKSKKK